MKDFAVAYLGWKGDEKYRSEKLLQQGMATGRRVGRNTIVEESRLSQRRNKMRQGRVLFTQEFDHNSDNDNSSATVSQMR